MNKIKELRQYMGLSQAELAEKLNVTRQSISLYEKGQRVPRINVLKNMEAIFGVPISYIQGQTTYLSPIDKANLVSQKIKFGKDEQLSVLTQVLDDSKKDDVQKLKKQLNDLNKIIDTLSDTTIKSLYTSVNFLLELDQSDDSLLQQAYFSLISKLELALNSKTEISRKFAEHIFKDFFNRLKEFSYKK
ncbi:helix-turn-helix domain-containing protein [Lactiplantibacillus plantarum]|uniref:helix-turn-helix domain-containing protein n=1 Tax=Lactiplantibacillus plantarum TaxID=1590 RepID=UPI003218BE2C